MEGCKVLVIVGLLIQLGGGKDLYWKPNSNWNNPNNWATGKVPACGESVSLQKIPDNSIVYLDSDTTVASIALPQNGQILLGESVTLRLTPDTECTVSGASPPMAVPVVNEFVGVSTNYWECPHNWMTSDGSPVEHAPCADDTAFFEKGYFSFVNANSSIFVRSMTVRGTSIKFTSEINTTEFNLKLEVNPKCADNPTLCPCPDDSKCPKPPPTKAPSTSKPGLSSSARSGGVIAGVLVPIIVLVIASLVIVAVIVTIYKCRTKTTYVKEDLVEEPADAVEGKGTYDNPIFSDDIKVDLGTAAVSDVPKDEGIFESNGDNGKKKKTKEPKLNEYERF